MNPLDSIRIALRALRANTLRSALTVLGIIVGVAAVVCMVAVGAGAQAQVSDKIRTLGANLLMVLPGAQSTGGARLATGTRQTLTEDDAAAIRREVSEVQVAGPLISRTMQLVVGNQNWSTGVAGVSPDYLVAREWMIPQGRIFSAEEMETGAKVAIIGTDIADELLRDQSPLGADIRIGSVPFTIIGVLGKKGQGSAGRSQDDVVFIPLATAKSRVLGAIRGTTRESLDMIMVKVTEASAMGEAETQIKALLRQRHQLRDGAPDDFLVQNPAAVLSAREQATRTLTVLLIAIASVSLVVGGISIMNIMLVSVTERTREIGLRMAVGARRRDIQGQFLIEAVVLAFVGGLAGALIGSLAAMAIAWKAEWPILISPEAILIACGFAGLVGVAFGFYPAWRASRLDPMVALRSE